MTERSSETFVSESSVSDTSAAAEEAAACRILVACELTESR